MVLLLTVTLSTYAQNKIVTVSGRVIEAGTKEPVELAAVQLLSLPDSAQVAGMTTSAQGYFSLSKQKPGKYLLKVSFIGYITKVIPVQLTANVPAKKMGNIELATDAVMLKEAVVVAEAPQVTVVEDTLMYNSSAYRTPEGAMLEELVKKLPGAEIDDDGNVKINGKELKKIMVDGKEFFGGDVKTGLKNLPVDMVDKLKTYDKKSDLARVTGIDDGEEETVLDLTVKKGMNQGWFGNADLGAGTKDRYTGRMMLNRFIDNTQFSIIGSANNVNDQGFSGGGGGPRWRSNNGLNATKMLGATFATQTNKIELGGSVRYNFQDGDISSINSSERFLQNGNSYSNSNNKNRNKGTNVNADFRMEWKPDTLTNIIFRPNFSYGRTNNASLSESGTFNEDPFNLVANPNDYLNFDNLSLIPSNVNLAGAEIELIGVEDKEFILKNAIDQVRDQYDFIIIDCPPSLNMLTINAMTTADTVLVPIQCEYYALEGLSQLMHTIELVQERLNPELEMEGVVFTMYDARTNLSLQVVENVKDSLDQNIYKTIIPRNVRLAEAPSYGMPINYYDKRSTGAESYRLLADEVIHRGDEE